MADLLTLEQLKLALKDSTTTNDDLYEQVIPIASRAVRTHCQRGFLEVEDSFSTRRFIYDGSGVLEIDDADEVESVTIVRSGAENTELTADEYEPQPYRNTDLYMPYYWIDTIRTGEASPAMGFTRNLDTLWPKYLLGGREVFVDVSAKWGWETIPEDIMQATLWTAVAFLENPRNVISEHVAGVGRTYANPARGVAVPKRAEDLLYYYTRLK